MPNGRSFALGAVNQLLQQQQQGTALRQALMEAQIKQQTQQLDPSRILSELELMNVINQMRQSGQIPGMQPQIQPQGQIPMQQVDAPAPVPQPAPIGQPQIPVQRQPQIPAISQPQVPQRQYERVFKGYGKYGQPEYETKETLASELIGKSAEERIKAKTEVLKLSEKARASFGRSISMFKNIVAQVKGAQEEQKRVMPGTTGLGVTAGIVGRAGALTKRPEFARVAAFRGQRTETALSLNSILTGQNRVIRSVVDMIYNTLPDPYDPEEMAASKLAQSIKNAYMLVKAYEKAGFTPAKLRELTTSKMTIGNKTVSAIEAPLPPLYTLSPEEENEIESIINDVLATPAIPARTFKGTVQQPGKKTYRSLWE